MLLDTDDSSAILGYAALGATALGTEPSDWMSAVLRGRRLSLEQSLGVLADSVKKHFPQHMVKSPAYPILAHNLFVPALVKGEARLYSIDLVFSPDLTNYNFRYTRHLGTRSAPAKPRAPRLAVTGSGALYLMKRKAWMRDILKFVKAYDDERILGHTVADRFAALNDEVYRNLGNDTVGPRCIVVWRNAKDGPRRGGGDNQFYTHTMRDGSSSALPIIANGMDVRAIAELMMPRTMEAFLALNAGKQPPEFDKDRINAELARLPHKPDENLR